MYSVVVVFPETGRHDGSSVSGELKIPKEIRQYIYRKVGVFYTRGTAVHLHFFLMWSLIKLDESKNRKPEDMMGVV
jgi:hypothetical protein